ncbi:hypothetical protein ACI2J4_10450 [Agrobacterium tumefaciens]|uniref:hypothetical protein n=1 Tax=Agrobacterium tumefaciens TaxID=358 RepID=UPI00384E53A1
MASSTFLFLPQGLDASIGAEARSAFSPRAILTHRDTHKPVLPASEALLNRDFARHLQHGGLARMQPRYIRILYLLLLENA